MEPLVIKVFGSRVSWLLYGYVFAINGTTTIVVIPPVGESLGNLLPLIWCFRALQDLGHIHIDDGLQDVWYKFGDGTLGTLETIL